MDQGCACHDRKHGMVDGRSAVGSLFAPALNNNVHLHLFLFLFFLSDGPHHPLLCTPLAAQVAQAGGPELAGAAARKASSPVSAVGAPVGAGTGSAEVRRCSVAATTPRKNTQNHAIHVVMDGWC